MAIGNVSLMLNKLSISDAINGITIEINVELHSSS